MNNYSMYGIDWNGPLSDEDDFEQVGVVNTCNPLGPIDFAQLQGTIDPLGTSETMGIDIYIRTLQFVYSKLT